MRPTTLLPDIHAGDDNCVVRVNMRPSVHCHESALNDVACSTEWPMALT